MTNTKQTTILEQVLSVISAGLTVHSQKSSVSLDDLDIKISNDILSVVQRALNGNKETQFSIDSQTAIANVKSSISDIQNQVASLPPVSASHVSYALGRNRIPQIFYAPKNLTQEQIEHLAIRTEQVIEKDVYCLAPEEYIKSLWDKFYDGDDEGWHNLPDEDDEYTEIYQYFFVSDWLGEILSNIGMIVYDGSYGFSIWGRTTFGCSFDVECTIQKALSVAFGYETYQKDDEDESEDDEDDEDDELED
jgi:hypothetical protein